MQGTVLCRWTSARHIDGSDGAGWFKESDVMRFILKALVLSATIAAVSAPALAHADGYISPFLGTNFGNNSGNGRTNIGVDAGWMGAGVIGAEFDFGYAPNFFG